MSVRSSAAWRGALVLFALFLAGAAGCGDKYKQRATVSGTVTFNGKPVSAGMVSFFSTSDSRVGSAVLNKQGQYTMKDAPIGEVTITVQTPPRIMGPGVSSKPPPGMGQMKPPPGMAPPDAGQTAADPRHVLPVPDKYTKADKSPLKYMVTAGTQTKDLSLTP